MALAPRGISAIVSSDSFLIYLLQAPQHQGSLPAPPRGSPIFPSPCLSRPGLTPGLCLLLF